MIRDRPSRLLGVAVRSVESAPPAVVRIAVLGIQEGLELGVGDGVAGDAEALARAVLSILVDERAAGNLDPVDVR